MISNKRFYTVYYIYIYPYFVRFAEIDEVTAHVWFNTINKQHMLSKKPTSRTTWLTEQVKVMDEETCTYYIRGKMKKGSTSDDSNAPSASSLWPLTVKLCSASTPESVRGC